MSRYYLYIIRSFFAFKSNPYVFTWFLSFFSLIYSPKEVLSQTNEDVKQLKMNEHSTNDSIRFAALRELHYFYCYRNLDTAKIYLDKLQVHVEKMNDYSHTATSYGLKGRWFSIVGDYDSAQHYYLLAIPLFRKAGNIKSLAGINLLIGNLYSDKGQIDSTLFYYKKAELAYKSINSSFGLARIYTNLGAVYSDMLGENAKAVEYYYKALKYDEEQDDISGQAVLHLNIGNNLTRLDQLNEAKKEITKGITLTHEIGDWHNLSYGYSLLSSVYKRIGSESNSTKYAELSLKFAQEIGNPTLVLNGQYKLISTYQFYEKWNKALKLLNEKMILLSELKITDFLITYHKVTAHLSLALCHYKLNNLTAYRNHLNLAEEIKVPIEKLSASEYANYLKDYRAIYEASGQYKKALNYYNLTVLLEDSLNTLQNNKVISQLKAQYESEKKEQLIKNLQQRAAIQSLKWNVYVIASISILVFIVVAGFFYYRQYRIKRDKSALELEQRFLRSQLNPHFIFNSMGAIQQYLLTESEEKASDYISIFSRLMRQILENSREEFITIEEEVSMLKNYLEVQKLRFKNRFNYTIEIEDTLDVAYDGIPPMFAQPFIENALEHGLFKKEQSEIKITFSKGKNNLIQLEILDNGSGVIEMSTKSDHHQSLATKITKERLEKMRVTYKAELSIHMQNITDESGQIEGYRVRLNLPSKLVA